MGFYRTVLLPKLCDLSMRNRNLRPYRERIIGAAQGCVLEIGAGSGLNLKFYGPLAREILALEPDCKLIAMARRNASAASRPITFIEGSAEEIPLERGSIDTVVTTWTLCTIPNVARALGEMRRVLKPGGTLRFVEHGLAPELRVQKWQHRLTPLWRRLSGGCHLDRPISEIIEAAGFRIHRLQTGYLPGPKIMTFLYEGNAQPG